MGDLWSAVAPVGERPPHGVRRVFRRKAFPAGHEPKPLTEDLQPLSDVDAEGDPGGITRGRRIRVTAGVSVGGSAWGTGLGRGAGGSFEDPVLLKGQPHPSLCLGMVCSIFSGGPCGLRVLSFKDRILYLN